MTIQKLNEKIRKSIFIDFCKANAKYIVDNGLESIFNRNYQHYAHIRVDYSYINILNPPFNLYRNIDDWVKMRDKVLLIHFNQYLKCANKYDLYRRFFIRAVRENRVKNFSPMQPYLDKFCCGSAYIMNWQTIIHNIRNDADNRGRLYYTKIKENIDILHKEKHKKEWKEKLELKKRELEKQESGFLLIDYLR